MVTQNWKDLMEHVYAHSQTVGHVQGMPSWEEGGAGTLLGGCMCIYIHMYEMLEVNLRCVQFLRGCPHCLLRPGISLRPGLTK